MRGHAGYTVDAVAYELAQETRLKYLSMARERRRRKLKSKEADVDKAVDNIIEIIYGRGEKDE